MHNVRRKGWLIFIVALCMVFQPVLPGIAGSDLSSEETAVVSQNINQLPGSANYVPGQLIVRFKDAKAANTIDEVNDSIGAAKIAEFKEVKGLQAVSLPEGTTVEEALQEYRQNPNVLYAEPNYIYTCDATPTDSRFGELWGLNNIGQTVNGTAGTNDVDIDAPEAWDSTTGTKNVVVAVVDTGVDYTHPELAANIWNNVDEIAGDGLDNDNNGYIDDVRGWDFVNDDNDPMDENNHGTHCSGTIAAAANDSNNIAGVMWNASIMPVRFLSGSGSGSTLDGIKSILYATRNGADIISCSWGGGGYSQALRDAIDYSSALVVCSAGNDAANNDSVKSYPGSYDCDNIIAVAATDQNDNLASFSSYGATTVDLAAPGTNILSSVRYTTAMYEKFSNLDNWNAAPPWALASDDYWSNPSSITDSPGGNYANNTNTSITLKNPIDLSQVSSAYMTYMMRIDIPDENDAILIEASTNGTNWTQVDGWWGTGGTDWYSFYEDLDAFAGQSTVYLRFRMQSDSATTGDGVYIDNLRVMTAPTAHNSNQYEFYQGTSMATPHVSGVAGLVKSLRPDLNNLQIKECILNGVDSVSALSGRVATGGRLNAQKALNQASNYQVTPASGPDLTIKSCTLSTPYIYSGSKVKTTVEIENKGTSASTANTTVQFYLQTEAESYLLATKTVSKLKTTAKPKKISVNLKMPATPLLDEESGLVTEAWIIAIVDPNKIVDANNNGNASFNQVEVAYPDLAVSALSAPAQISAGQKFKVTETTCNLGDAPSPKSYTGFVLMSDDPTQQYYLYWLKPVSVSALKPQAQKVGKATLALPPAAWLSQNLGWTSGSYTLIARADFDVNSPLGTSGLIKELNEINNYSSQKINLTINNSSSSSMTSALGEIASCQVCANNQPQDVLVSKVGLTEQEARIKLQQYILNNQ
ncbi:MAG: S8 family serine peptidase [Chitinophagales bacterium]